MSILGDQTASQLPRRLSEPEWGLLLSCVRSAIDPGDWERIPGKLADMDWAVLLPIAAQHGVMPLLYRTLSRNWPEAVPGAVLRDIGGYCRETALRNLFLTSELLELLGALESDNVSAVPYKGPLLALSAYGDVSLREFHDLDVLVRERDVVLAKHALASRGYNPVPSGAPDGEPPDLRDRRALRFERHDGRVAVDLHWGVTLLSHFSFPLDEDGFWSQLDTVPLGGREVASIPPEIMVQILCIHGSRHCWGRLAWICDVAEIVRRHPDLDWDRIVTQARECGNERMLLVGLSLAQDLLGAGLPNSVMSLRRADPAIASAIRAVRQRLVDPFDSSAARTLDSYAFRLGMKRTLRSRATYFLSLARRAATPNTQDRTWIKLPDALSLLYYLVRPVRLILKYGMSCFLLPARLFGGWASKRL